MRLSPYRRLRSIALPVLLLAFAIPYPATAWGQGQTWSHTRGGWLVGLGFAGGSAGISEADDREGGFGGNFHVGYGFNPQVALELQSNAWLKEENGATLTFSVGSVGLSFYPGESGFYMRAGVGFGTAEVDFGGSTTSEDGFGLLLATGYEFRVLRTFAFGPQLDFGYGSLESFDFNYVNGGIQGTWYFIPRTK